MLAGARRRRQSARSPEDLARCTLLHLEWSSAYPSWPAWSDWLKAAGAKTVEARHGVWFNNMAMAMRAAAQGQGVALSSLAIAADELAAGRLVAPFSTSVSTPFGYYFLCRPEEAQTPADQGACASFWSKRRRCRRRSPADARVGGGSELAQDVHHSRSAE